MSDAGAMDTLHRIGGQVHGLWDGTDGVALRLESDAVDTLLTVARDGSFSFAKQLAKGASYTVTVATNPTLHTCVVATGGNGTVADADIMNSSILCSGPAKDLVLTGQWGWRFDPTSDVQQFSGSILAQDVAFTITGDDLTGATVGGATAAIGTKTAAIALALGTTAVPVALTAKGGLSKTYQLVFARAAATLEQAMYGKASNTGVDDNLGVTVAISGDTMAVGAPDENSAATGINGDQNDNTGRFGGAVYVFVRSGTTWTQQAYLKASNTSPDIAAWFGKALALSGNTLAVGADFECNSASGVNGNQSAGRTSNSGAVYVFVRTGTTWSQQAYVKASNPGLNDNFGFAVALSGNTLAVGAVEEDSAATGINGVQADDTASGSGAVYVFARSGTTWRQEAYIKASNTDTFDQFGSALALAGDTLVVGAPGEASAADSINGDQADNTASFAGAVYVFSRTGTSWAQQAYLKASNANAQDAFGSALALSGDTLVVGATEDSGATGINGNQADNTANAAGAAYVFVRSGATWTQQAYLKASNTQAGDEFGFSFLLPPAAGERFFATAVALSGDLLAVGASAESSAGTGIGGSQLDNTAPGAGAVYVFARTGTTWTPQAYVKASNTGGGDRFGFALALSGDTLVVGAPLESSAATGINGNQADDSARGAGAIYLFR